MRNRRSVFEWARDFSGDPESHEVRGLIIRDFLREQGMRPDSNVLELGCGCLSAGRYLIDYLDSDRYFALEPAGWQVESALAQKEIKPLTVKRPRFDWRDDFDGSAFGVRFDFVVGHSILSHCAAFQWPLLLANCRRAMAPGAKMLLSFRLGNDSNADHWTYPDVTHFSWETIERVASDYPFSVELRPDYTERMVEKAPNDVHDWLLLTREEQTWQEFLPYSDDELRLRFDLDAPFDRRRLLASGAGRMVTRTD